MPNGSAHTLSPADATGLTLSVPVILWMPSAALTNAVVPSGWKTTLRGSGRSRRALTVLVAVDMNVTLLASRLVAATTVSVLLMSMAVARLSRGSSTGTFWQLHGVAVLANAQNWVALHAGVQVGASGSHNTGAPEEELLEPPTLEAGGALLESRLLEPATDDPVPDVPPLTPEEEELPPPEVDEEEEDEEELLVLEVSSLPVLPVQPTPTAVVSSMPKVHGT